MRNSFIIFWLVALTIIIIVIAAYVILLRPGIAASDGTVVLWEVIAFIIMASVTILPFCYKIRSRRPRFDVLEITSIKEGSEVEKVNIDFVVSTNRSVGCDINQFDIKPTAEPGENNNEIKFAITVNEYFLVKNQTPAEIETTGTAKSFSFKKPFNCTSKKPLYYHIQYGKGSAWNISSVYIKLKAAHGQLKELTV